MTISVNSISRLSALVAEDLVDPPAGGVLAEARRHAAVDLQVGPGGDHVDLVGGVRHRRGQRHAEHRLDQHQQPRVDGGDPLERRRRVVRVRAEACEQRGRRLGQLERRLRVGDPLERRRQLEQRVLSGPGQRGVAGDAARGQLEAEDPLLGAAHAVAAAAVVLEHVAGALVEEHVAADAVGMGGGQPVGADVAAGLLVGDEHELQAAALRSPTAAGQRGRRDRLGRHLGLHVERTAAPQEAVDDVARPGIVRPLRRVGEDRVDVPEVHQRGTDVAAAAAVEVGDEVRAVLVVGQQLGPQAGVLQVPGEELDRGALVARRVDRVEADQFRQQVGRLALELIGRHAGRERTGILRRIRRAWLPPPRTWSSRSSSPTSPTAITLARFRAADLVVETKPDLTPVTEADTAVERARARAAG